LPVIRPRYATQTCRGHFLHVAAGPLPHDTNDLAFSRRSAMLSLKRHRSVRRVPVQQQQVTTVDCSVPVPPALRSVVEAEALAVQAIVLPVAPVNARPPRMTAT
jgi:hypothetical protein